MNINNRALTNSDNKTYEKKLRKFLYEDCEHSHDDTPCSLCIYYRKNPEIGSSYYCMHKDHPENTP